MCVCVCVCVLVFDRVVHVCVCVCVCVCVQCGVGALRVTKSNLLWSNQSQCLPSHISGRALRSATAHRPTHTHTYTHTHIHTFHTLNTPTLPLQGTLRDLSPLAKSRSPQHLHHGWRDHSGKQETEVSVLGAIYRAGSVALRCRESGSTCPLQKTLQFRVCTEATWANWLVVQMLYFHSGICFGGLRRLLKSGCLCGPLAFLLAGSFFKSFCRCDSGVCVCVLDRCFLD